MEYLNKIANLQDYVLGNAAEYFELIIYAGVSFFLPLLMGHPQIVVGIVVNAMLITSALNLKGYKLWPVILLPSLGVLSRGIIFGPFTIFLVYMIPFIWIGNAILVYAFKIMKLHMKINYIFTLVAGAGLKTGFLFLSAFVLFKLGIIPVIFLTSMGLMQLWTALGGGIAAAGVHYTKKRLSV
ncbi:hypothetical protein KY345_02775 [Candidatus Woesearchaeota archaeon]|nr:hypothetical protein [Candidatus Woesearchaeota archaeon]